MSELVNWACCHRARDAAVLYGIVAAAHGLAVFVAGDIQYLARAGL